MVDILMIEDNDELGQLTFDFLQRGGYSVVWEKTAENGIEFLSKAACRMLLLDVMLPGMDGYEALQQIRKTMNFPVLMMSARTDDGSKILGLDMGADDYIDKPFSFSVLSSKINAMLRRGYEMQSFGNILVFKNITVDVDARTVKKDDAEINIGGKEFDILVYFMQHKNQVIYKEKLFNEIWGADCFSEMNTMNVYIRWLREKLEEDPSHPTLIQTVWKVGYRFGGEN